MPLAHGGGKLGHVDFRVLGPVEARAEGRALELAGARQRALLAVLLLRAGEPVSRERVIADLWGERPPAGAVKTVQAVVSRLRRALGGEAARLVSSAAGYRLRVEPDELDLDRFERLCADGRRALAAGRHERAAARLRAALAEWRGPPLADVAFEPFTPPEVARLEDLRAAAVEDRVEADLAMGRGAELVAELEGLVAAEPLRERLRGQLMLALYRAGRRGEALDVYRDAVRTLDSELGLRPGPELERLQQAILAHDPALLRAPAGGEAREVERRRATATILVAEVAGWTRVGDADADGVRAAHDRRLRDVLAARGASAVKAVGDALVAAFASAGAAIACAVEMQRAIDREARRGAVALELRVGVAAGDVTWAGEDSSGTPVIEAQRLCAAASAGSILVADAVRLLAGSGTEAELDDAGELELGDLARPVRAWSAGWTARRAVTVPFPASLVFEGGTAFAGREEELAGLRAAWADAVSGSRRGVLISGEPGIGKTRLAAEIAAHARAREGIVLYGRCDDGLSAPAQPFAEALGAYIAACPVDELRVELGARAGDLVQLLPELAARLPGGVAEPAPAEPEIQRLRTLEAAAALLDAAAEAAPMLLVLDDLHWADDLSLLLLRHLLRTDAAARLLVLATYRDTEPSRSALLGEVVTGLARRPDVARLELGPLRERDIAALLANAGRQPSQAGHVLRATAGNPFFVAEMVRALDHGPRSRRCAHPARARRRALAPCPAARANGRGAGGRGRRRRRVRRRRSCRRDRRQARSGAGRIGGRRIGAARAARQGPGWVHLRARARARDDRRRAAARTARAPSRADRPRARARRRHAPGADRRPGRALRRRRHARRRHTDPLVRAQAGDEAAARLAFDVAAEHYERAVRAHRRLPSAPENERLDLELARGRALALAGDNRAHAGPARRRGRRRHRQRRRAHGRGAADDPGSNTPTSSRRTPRWSLCCAAHWRCWRRATARSGHLLEASLAERGVLQHARSRAPGNGRPAR